MPDDPLGSTDSLVDEDRPFTRDQVSLRRAPGYAAPAFHGEAVPQKLDVEAAVHATDGEPELLSWYLVQDPDGRVTQHASGVASPVEHTADPAIDDVPEMPVKRVNLIRGQRRRYGFQVALSQNQRLALLYCNAFGIVCRSVPFTTDVVSRTSAGIGQRTQGTPLDEFVDNCRWCSVPSSLMQDREPCGAAGHATS